MQNSWTHFSDRPTKIFQKRDWGKMKNRDYAMATIEEFLAIPQDNTNLVIALPQRALNEIEAVKNAKNRQELVTRALKKYVINIL